MNNLPKGVLVTTDGTKDAAVAVRAAVDISEKTGAECRRWWRWGAGA